MVTAKLVEFRCARLLSVMLLLGVVVPLVPLVPVVPVIGGRAGVGQVGVRRLEIDTSRLRQLHTDIAQQIAAHFQHCYIDDHFRTRFIEIVDEPARQQQLIGVPRMTIASSLATPLMRAPGRDCAGRSVPR